MSFKNKFVKVVWILNHFFSRCYGNWPAYVLQQPCAVDKFSASTVTQFFHKHLAYVEDHSCALWSLEINQYCYVNK